MFRGRQRPLIVHPLDKSHAQRRDPTRIVAKGPDVNDGIVRSHINIHHVRIQLVNANGPGFPGSRASLRKCQVGIMRGAQRHGRGECRAPRHLMPEAAFQIGRDQQGNRLTPLQLMERVVYGCETSPEDTHTTDVIPVYRPSKLCYVGTLPQCGSLPVQWQTEHLADFFRQGE